MERFKFENMDAGNRKPFAVPDNYFADFAEKIMDQTSEVKPAQKPRRTLRVWMSVAAAFVGIIVVSTVLIQVHQQTTYNEEESYEMYLAAQFTDDIYYDYYVDNVNDETKK